MASPNIPEPSGRVRAKERLSGARAALDRRRFFCRNGKVGGEGGRLAAGHRWGEKSTERENRCLECESAWTQAGKDAEVRNSWRSGAGF